MKTSDIIINIFQSCGFPLVGLINAKDAVFHEWINPWLEKGYHAEMQWFERNQDLRCQPALIDSFCSTLIVLGMPYYTGWPSPWGMKNIISNYAWGEDYHFVLQKKITIGLQKLVEIFPTFQGRSFVDTAPLPEKILAQQSGLGWIGKNGLLINPNYGSFIFLGVISTNFDLPSSQTFEKDYCQNCNLCQKACPTQAIQSNKMIDARRCLAYLTIEKKHDFSVIEHHYLQYQVIGCDICQKVCPWNQKLPISPNPAFQCHQQWLKMDVSDFLKLNPDIFKELTEKTTLEYVGYNKIQRNAKSIMIKK